MKREAIARADLLDAAPDAILLVESDGTIAYANATSEEITGYSVSELLTANIDLLVPSGMQHRHARHRATYQRRPRTRPMGPGLDLMLRRADGSDLPVDISLAPVTVDGMPMVMAAIRDASERHRAERERGELIGRLERTRERERIAGDVHDELIQSVYAVGLDLQAARSDEQLSKDQAIDRAVSELQAAIADVRAYIDYLRGEQADDESDVLATRLRSLLRSYSSGPNWHADIHIDEPIGSRIGRELYLVVKELVSNVERHSGATEAWIVMYATEVGVRLTVEDNGAGFDVDETRPGAFGLENLRQRVVGLGAVLQIESRPGHGTTVTVLVPTD